MAWLIWSAVAPGASVLKMVVLFGMPPGTPAFDQSAALSGLRMPRQFWASRDGDCQRDAKHNAAAGRPRIPLLIADFMAGGLSGVAEWPDAASAGLPSG